MTRVAILAATLLAVTALAQEFVTRDVPVAMGNIGVHYNLNGIISTDKNPLTATTNGNIWCMASFNGVAMPAVSAKFIRLVGRKEFPVEVDSETFKATYKVDQVVHEQMGKYRCEIEVAENDENKRTVFGNLFVYSSPFFHSNGSFNMRRKDETNRNILEADKLYATEGADFDIECPATGYPKPTIVWYRNNNELIDFSSGSRFRVSNNGTRLTIEKITQEDKGVYTCTATNHYPTRLDLDERPYEASLEQEVQIGGGPYGWLLPLLVILVTLLLLFIIIYACAACKRYQHDNYNVAKREKLIRTPSPASSSATSAKKYELVSSP